MTQGKYYQIWNKLYSSGALEFTKVGTAYEDKIRTGDDALPVVDGISTIKETC